MSCNCAVLEWHYNIGTRKPFLRLIDYKLLIYANIVLNVKLPHWISRYRIKFRQVESLNLKSFEGTNKIISSFLSFCSINFNDRKLT